jgi:hypothetical protein
VAAIQMLKSGVIYWDTNGNLLPSSSSAYDTAGYSVNIPANNQNQLNGIISTSWALPSTNIPQQLRILKKTARQLSGYPLKYAFYGENCPSYLQINEFVKDWFIRYPEKRDQFYDTAEIPDGTLGFTWIPVYESFYEDQNGTNQALWNADQVTFTPPLTGLPDHMRWWRMIEGSWEVPTSLNVQSDAMESLKSCKTVWGMGGYSAVIMNPVRITAFMFDTFLPTIVAPATVFQAITAFSLFLCLTLGLFCNRVGAAAVEPVRKVAIEAKACESGRKAVLDQPAKDTASFYRFSVLTAATVDMFDAEQLEQGFTATGTVGRSPAVMREDLDFLLPLQGAGLHELVTPLTVFAHTQEACSHLAVLGKEVPANREHAVTLDTSLRRSIGQWVGRCQQVAVNLKRFVKTNLLRIVDAEPDALTTLVAVVAQDAEPGRETVRDDPPVMLDAGAD